MLKLGLLLVDLLDAAALPATGLVATGRALTQRSLGCCACDDSLAGTVGCFLGLFNSLWVIRYEGIKRSKDENAVR